MKSSLKECQVLVVEDDVLLRRTLAGHLRTQGAAVAEADRLAKAEELVRGGGHFDFALIDLNLPDGQGLKLLRGELAGAATTVVIMTAEGALESAVEAMRLGAVDYLTKPFDLEEVPLVLRRAREQRRRQRRERFEKDAQGGGQGLYLEGTLRPLRQMLDRILAIDARLGERLPPVLIEGETGTGKTTLARWLHDQGPRAEQPFLGVNCATLPESLAESELFGHEKGAFTDAKQARMGLWEAADGGTLFLDEIASLSPAVQAKLLTAIEDGRIRRLGGARDVAVEVRLMAASLHDLAELSAQGRFRADLFHRLNLLRLRVPPLRDRLADMPALAEHLLGPLRRRYRRAELVLDSVSIHQLQGHTWPGNIRELAHELERAVIFSVGGALRFDHLDDGSKRRNAGAAAELLSPGWVLPEEGFKLEEALEDVSRRVVAQAMARARGNVSAAARLLGVPRDYLRYRMKEPGG